MNVDADGMIGWGVGAGGVLLAVGQMAWQRFFSREGQANDALVAQLTERIQAQEQRLQSIEAGLDEERKSRRQAENEVFALRMRVQRLESELMAAKSVVVSHEKIFERLAALQAPQAKSVNAKKNSVDSQNSLFNSEE